MDCLTLHGHFEILAHPQCWSAGTTLRAREGAVRMRTPAHAASMQTNLADSAAFRRLDSSLPRSVKKPNMTRQGRWWAQAAT